MRIRILSVLIVAVAILASGCHNEPQIQYKTRFDRFKKLLTGQEAGLLESFEFGKAAALFAARMQSDSILKKKYETIIADENVEMFPPQKVFDFFGGSVFARILYYRFIGFIEGAELAAFNEYRLVETANLLDTRLNADPSLQRRFLALFSQDRQLDIAGRAALIIQHYLAANGRMVGVPAGQAAAVKDFIRIRPDVADGIRAILADKKADAFVEGWGMRQALGVLFPKAGETERLAGFVNAGAASLQRYRILALVVFFRDVLDERIDFYTEESRRRLQSLL